MKTICITQARLTSSRLSKKVLLPLYEKKNALNILQYRVSRSQSIDKHIFAIPNDTKHVQLESYLSECNLIYSKGDEQDLISRYMGCLGDYEDCIIVRVTSDCPLVDPDIIDEAVNAYKTQGFDYVSNYTPAETSKYCNGSDVEVFSKSLLMKINNLYTDKSDREHVTFPLWDGRMPEIRHYRLFPKNNEDYSDIRITLDYYSDLKVIRQLLSHLDYRTCNISNIVKKYRELNLSKINGHHHFDEGWS